MAYTLATVRDQLENRLVDATILIFSTTVLDEALRASLAEISNSYGTALTLNGLDAATETTIEDVDIHSLLVGGMAYACRFRLAEKYEEASPEREHPEHLAAWATQFMHEFLSLATLIKLRKFQKSSTNPHTVWDWDEGDDFT